MRKFVFLIFLHLSVSGAGKSLHLPALPPDTIRYSGSEKVCQGGNLLLTADPALPSAAYQWKINGANIPGAVSPTCLATQSGTYTVQVNTATYKALKVIIDPVFTADFTFSSNTCSGNNIQFTSTATGGTAPFTYSWVFGDGSVSSSQNPVHAFFSPAGCGTQTFSAVLVIKDANGCTRNITKTLDIKKLPDVLLEDEDPFSPFSNCDKSPTGADPDFTLTVKNVSPGAACISTYSIDWGDGTIQNGITAASFPLTHMYTRVGAFNLVISGLGTNGCTGLKKYVVANQSNPAGSLGTLGSTTNLCAPATVPFTIGNWQINSPGTTYILNFGDGISDTLTHPLNATSVDQAVNHTYTKTSCPQNSYTAVLQVINACDITPYSAGNIQIREKPTALFTTPLPACAGVDLCFDNTTNLGSYGPTCSDITAFNWDFGDASAPSDAKNPCHRYANPGNYLVTLTASNPCGTSEIKIPVCVTTPPVPGFTVNNVTGCAPFNLIATNTTSSLNNCVPLSYLWAVSYEQAYCGNSSLWAFTNGTTDSSENPSFIFNNPGKYTITLAVTNPCGTFTTSNTITVKQPPVVTLAPVASSCDPVTFTPAADISSCGDNILTYLWTFSGGNPGSSTNQNPGPVSFNATGAHTVFLSATNECSTTTVSEDFSINDITRAIAGPAQTICGSAVTMAANAAISGSGLWTQISGPNVSAIATPALAASVISGLIPGTYTFRWTISNGSCSNSSDVVITILSGETSNAGPDQHVCAATGITLAANASLVPDSAAWSFVSGPAGAVLTSPNSPSTTVTGLVAGIYVFRWTIKNTICPASTDDVQITIDETATTAIAGPNQSKCGTTATMAANAPLIGTGIWTTISGPNTPLIISPSSPATSITGLIPGTYSFQWTIANGSCSSSSNVIVVIAEGASTASAGPDQDLCLAASATLAANVPTVGTGAWSYVSGPSGYTFTDATSPTTTVTGLVPGNYVFRWAVSFSSCTTNSDEVNITIYNNPTIAAAGPDQIICASNASLAANTPATGTGSWSLISGPGASAITVPSSPATTITGMVAGTYLFKWTISNLPCPSSADTVQITVTGITNNSLNGSRQICFNTLAGIITGSVPSGGYGSYSYQWQQSMDNGNTWTIIGNESKKDFSPGVLTQTTCYRRGVTTEYCSDTSGTYSTPICIKVNPDAQALFNTVDSIVCPHVNIDTLIKVTPFPDRNNSYNWYADNIFITGNTTGDPPSYLLNNPGQTVHIKLVTTGAFGCRADSNSITFKTLPAVIAGFKKDVLQGCGPVTVAFTNTSSIADSTVEFYWDFGDGSPVQNIPQPKPVSYYSSASFRDTIYHITMKAFSGCDTTVWLDSVKVFADPQSRFLASSTGCSPFRDTITNNSIGNNIAYYWDFGDGKSDTTYTTGTVIHDYNTGIVDTFTIRLIAENICRKDTQSMNLVVSPSSIQSQISINGNELYGCAPHTVNFLNSSAGASLLYFNYGDGTPEDAVPNNQSIITHTFSNAGVDTIKIRLVNDCTDTVIVKYITVYAQPVSSFTIANTTICTDNTITTVNTSQNANSYEWIWGDNTTSSSLNASHSYALAGIYSVRLVARKLNNFGAVCTDTSGAITVTVVDRILPVIVIANNSQCVPYAITASAAGAENAALVDWYFYDSHVAPGTFHVTGSTASYTYNTDGIDSVKLIVQNLAGCNDSTVKQFTIHKTPEVNFAPFNFKTCNTDTTIVFNVSLDYDGTDPVNYTWYINDQPAGVSNPFSYHFQVPGGTTSVNDFVIKVLAQNSFGCGDTTAFGNFVIQTLAPQRISVAPSYVQEQPNYTFTFVDTSPALSNTTYLWGTGDRNLQQLPGKEIKYTYGDTGTYKVSLLVIDYETGCTQIDSTKVTILAVPGYLYVPNAFCPGCQKAELRNFLPLGKGLKDYRLSIFNIYGQKIFETTHLDANGVPDVPWNGNWADQKNAQQDAYSWHIVAHYINGTEWKGMNNKKSGFITIIR